MHPNSTYCMEQGLARWTETSASVLDVGSMDVNGTFRPMVEHRGWKYTGLDIVGGPNVDIVSKNLYGYPIEDGAYDIVISGSTMEHVGAIWVWIFELVRVLRSGGLLVIVVPTNCVMHRYPIDCWRVFPDGMECIFEFTKQLKDYDIAMYNNEDTMGSAFKI